MNRKAVLVAVGDYQGFANTLTAPVQEIARWRALLESPSYGFTILEDLRDADATRANVLDALESLFAGANADDQLVLVFAGHGTLARAWVTETTLGNEIEEALVVFPNGNADLQNAAITESDVERILREQSPPPGTHMAFVLDCCMSQGFDEFGDFRAMAFAAGADPMAGSVLLFAPPPVFVTRDTAIQGFARFRRPVSFGQTTLPIVVAACEENGAAYQIRDDGDDRMLFSMRALGRLAQNRDTYAALIRNIQPLRPPFPQRPALAGNRDLENEPFAGTPAAEQVPPLEEPETGIELETAAAGSIFFRVIGMCCFVESRAPQTDPYRTRLVMPLDTRGVDEAHHLAFIEINSDDFAALPAGLAPTKKYQRSTGGPEYWRWDLNRHTVSIEDGIAGAFVRSSTFTNHVPGMREVATELRAYPASWCFPATPDNAVIAAFVDFRSGSVDAGPLHSRETVFQRQTSGQTTWNGFTPLNVKVDVPVSSAVATIVISHGNPVIRDAEIQVRLGSTIFAGNARERDITGDGQGDVPTNVFLGFYELSHFMPSDPALPTRTATPVDNCSVTGWP